MFIVEWLRRLWYIVNRGRFERELQQDMDAHRAMMVEPRRFGNTLRLREESRDVWGWNWLDDLGRDLRAAARVLAKSPAFTIGAVSILSFSLGLNLTVFQLFNVTQLKPWPVRDIDSLVRFSWASKDGRSRNVPYRAVETFRSHNTVLSAILTSYPTVAYIGDTSQRFQTMFVSANWFEELGYNASMGRVLQPGRDDASDSEPVVVVSRRFWESDLHSDPDVVGKTIRVNNQPAVLVGVAPIDFPGLEAGGGGTTKAWIPIHQIDYFNRGGTFGSSWNNNVAMYGRLSPGVSAAVAKAALRNVFSELAVVQPQLFQASDWLEPVSGSDHFRNPVQRQKDIGEFVALALLPGLVLLIACANLGNLILSRSVGRVRELSVRVALGAGRWRVMRHLMSESLLLAAIGVAGAFAVGYSTITVWRAADASFPPVDPFQLDWRLAFAAALGLTVVTTSLGLIPALKISRRDLVAAMKDGGQQATSGLERTRLRTTLIAVQVAATCVLLMIAGMALRGFQRLQSNPGFDVSNMIIMDLSHDEYGLQANETRTYWNVVRDVLAASPDVEGTVLVSNPSAGVDTKISRASNAIGLRIAGTQVEPGFFDLLKIPVLTGRTFSADDDPETTVVISRHAAELMFGTLDVLGKGFPRSEPTRTIVGVVGDARVIRVDDVGGGQYYIPLTEKGLRLGALIVRSRNDPNHVVTLMRNAARSRDDRFIPEVRLMESDFEQRARSEGGLGLAISGLAGLALFLACIGIFSAISYTSTLRRKEIGIRMALGASGRAIVESMTRQTVRPLLISMLVGLSIGFMITRAMALKHPEYWVAFDPLLLAVVAFVCGGTTMIAVWIPAFRAGRVDVLDALRHE